MQLGRTLLHYAADHGNCDVVEVLLSNKADADASDKVSVATVNITVELVGCDQHVVLFTDTCWFHLQSRYLYDN